MNAYRGLVYETPGFIDYFFSATPIREIAELNIGSRPASRKATQAHRGPARDPLELQLGPVPRDAARLVRLRLRGARRSSARPASAQDAVALLQRMYRALAVLPHAAVQPRHGARQERPGDRARAMSSWSPDSAAAASASSAQIEAEWQRTIEALCADHRREAAPGSQPGAGALDRAPLPLPRPAEPPAGRADAPLPHAPRRRPANERVQRGIHISINGIAAGLRNTG